MRRRKRNSDMEYGLGGYKSIDAFVEAKLEKFGSMEQSYETLFELMFRETDNVMFERSEGYRIKKTTYGSVKENILARAFALREVLADLEYDSVVGLYMNNSLEWIECFWAIIVSGFRPLLLNLRLNDGMLTGAMRSAGCRAVISEGRTFDGVRCISTSDIEQGDAGAAADRFGTELLVMSSGTSASVKICAYTAEEFYYQIYDSYDIIKKCALLKKHYEGSLKLLTFLPFYHVFGLIAVYIWFAFFSRTFVHLADMAPQTIVNTIKRHRVTHVFAVPLFWEKVYEQAMKTIKGRGEKTYKKFTRAMALCDKLPDFAAAAISRAAFKEVRENLFGESICFMITGGSSIPGDVMRFFNGIGYRLADGYGMTEIGITSVELSSKRKYLNGCFVGSPMSHAEYSINEDGELLVRGKVIAKYVIENGEKKYSDGWFNTHDLASCENGHYKILGRRDDLIIGAGGENINPNLAEPALCPEGADGVCLIGVKDAENTVPVLLVSVGKYISKDKLLSVEAKTKELIEKAGLGTEIKKIAFVGEPLMKGDEFKLNRRRLADDYKSGALSLKDPAAVQNEEDADELTERVKIFFSVALGKEADEIALDADFFLDGGGASLDYFAMMTKLQEEFGIPFPTDGEHGLKTVREISDYIRKVQNG